MAAELGDGCAAGRRPVVRHDHRPGLKTERKTAVAAGRHGRLADDVALRAAKQQPGLVDITTLRTEWIQEAVARAVGLARGDDRPAEMVARRDARAFLVRHPRPRLRDAVPEPGEH